MAPAVTEKPPCPFSAKGGENLNSVKKVADDLTFFLYIFL